MNRKTIFAYSCVFLLSIIIATLVMHLWQADFSIPFAYEWRDIQSQNNSLDPHGSVDALSEYVALKGIYDHGWYLYNPNIGAPSGLDFHDYPRADSLHFLIIKLLCLASSNYAMAVNLFFVLGFPLAAITSLFTLRQLGISNFSAAVCSLLYAFLPYHFLRGEQHLCLSSYYMVPLMVLVVIWVMQGETFLLSLPRAKGVKKGGNGAPSIPKINLTRKALVSIAICVLVGCAGTYYALFGVIFLFAGVSLASFSQYSKKRFAIACMLSGIILLTLFVNYWPSINYGMQHGKNPMAAVRLNSDGEVYGLKIIQLLLPVMHHRIQAFSDFSAFYYTHAPLVTENVSACLGLVGSLGFLALIAWQLGLHWETSQKTFFSDLGKLNLACILLATVGGFGSLVAFGFSPLIRCYNRMSVYIAFFALIAVALLLEEFRRRYIDPKKTGTLWIAGLFILLCLGIADQTTGFFVPPYSENAASYQNDENFVRRIESMVPRGAMIFQMPYLPFPEGGAGDYQLFRGYLHSNTLRWSYGAMKGRETDTWTRTVLFADGDLKRIARLLIKTGFMGIYVDRQYFPGHAQAEEALKQLVDATPIESENHRLAFYSLTKSPQLYSEEPALKP